MDEEYLNLTGSDDEEKRKREKFQTKKKCRTISIMLGICIFGLAFLTFAKFNWFQTPLHASCKVKLSWSETDCDFINKAIVKQIKAWTDRSNCLNGGQKCLYTLISEDSSFIKVTHTTPVKAYVDTITFSFSDSNSTSCNIDAFSSSNLWYALLDFGTNYCNINNLITGASLDQIKGYAESTSDRICTQYSSANCTIY